MAQVGQQASQQAFMLILQSSSRHKPAKIGYGCAASLQGAQMFQRSVTADVPCRHVIVPYNFIALPPTLVAGYVKHSKSESPLYGAVRYIAVSL